MKESNTIRKTCKPILFAAALTVAIFPLLASAGAGEADRGATIFFDKSSRVVSTSESLYARLKAESRKVCGDSSIYLTGSVRRSAGIEECYDGTLTAAVDRLGDPKVSALHDKESTEL